MDPARNDTKKLYEQQERPQRTTTKLPMLCEHTRLADCGLLCSRDEETNVWEIVRIIHMDLMVVMWWMYFMGKHIYAKVISPGIISCTTHHLCYNSNLGLGAFFQGKHEIQTVGFRHQPPHKTSFFDETP